MNINAKNEISHYEGYKDTTIVRGTENDAWGNQAKTFRTQLISNVGINFPIGRLKWKVYDRNCALNTSKYLTLSHCEFGKEFTCSSGHCISIASNCDGKIDCADGSDETNCQYIRIPDSYKQIYPPATHINVDASIESIHDIDTIEMVVEMTQVIAFSWFDSRLEFTNLRNGTLNRVNDGLEKQIWNPFDHVVQENVLIGKLFCNDMMLYIEANTPPIGMDISDAFEDRRYDSSTNTITATQRSKGSYDCTFQLKTFPFDTQTCKFKSHLKPKKGTELYFATDNDSAVSYTHLRAHET